jgi:hypothetical protein
MTGQGKVVRGTAKIVTCRNCQASLPLFEFDSETDTDSVGLCSAARCNGLDIVIAETTLEEWKAIQSGTLTTLPARVSGSSEMKDFHVLHIKRVEQGSNPPAGIPFSEFRKLYKPPVVIYACPCCRGGEAIETQELTVSEFEKRGGRIIALGGLVVESDPPDSGKQ